MAMADKLIEDVKAIEKVINGINFNSSDMKRQGLYITK